MKDTANMVVTGGLGSIIALCILALLVHYFEWLPGLGLFVAGGVLVFFGWLWWTE